MREEEKRIKEGEGGGEGEMERGRETPQLTHHLVQS